ncbi:MAG: hypothetical protein ACOC6H_04540 [Thermoproteota archaeon]
MKFSEKVDPLLRKELIPLEEADVSEASRIYRELKRSGNLIPTRHFNSGNHIKPGIHLSHSRH